MTIHKVYTWEGLELKRGIEEEGRPIHIGELRVEGAIKLLRPIGSAKRTDTQLLIATIRQATIVQHVAYR